MEPAAARRIPEEFLELPGSLHQRVLLIVNRYWGAYPETEQDELVQALVSPLAPLLSSPSPRIPEALREACASAVANWERHALATDRSHKGTETVAIGASPPRPLRFLSASFTPLEGTGFGARVVLERPPGGSCVGFAQCATAADQLRCVAEAALDALRQAVPERGLRFELDQVGRFDVCGYEGALVSLRVKHQDRTWSLVGTCAAKDQGVPRLVALAVLDGTNRLLRTG